MLLNKITSNIFLFIKVRRKKTTIHNIHTYACMYAAAAAVENINYGTKSFGGVNYSGIPIDTAWIFKQQKLNTPLHEIYWSAFI